MLDFLFKKKVTEEKLAKTFVHSLVKMVEDAFSDVADLINHDTTLVRCPNIASDNYDKFMLIVVAGNLKFVPRHFNDYQDIRLMNHIYREFSALLGVTVDEFKAVMLNYQSYFDKVNQPSKNTLYAMSKAVFYKYNLNDYQEEYFKKMNSPNPILLKKLDDIMVNFIWSWEEINENYRIVE